MQRRALLFASISACFGVLACGGQDESATPADAAPIVGLYEIPISRRAQGAAPSDAVRVEISPTELRANGTKVIDLERGMAPAAEVSEHAIAKLRQAVQSGAARGRASVRVHANVPYLTLAQTLETLEAAGLREIHFAVRTVGATPQEGWMKFANVRVAPPGDEPVTFEGRALPWTAFTEHWSEVYDGCRAGQYIDCDFAASNIAPGGELLLELWTRGQGMKVTFRQVNAPAQAGAPTAPRVEMIEGVPAPPPSAGTEETPPATEAAFNFRHQESTNAESAISTAVHPVCANQACQAVVVADATSPSMRVLSMIGAVFPDGYTDPQLVFRMPELDR